MSSEKSEPGAKSSLTGVFTSVVSGVLAVVALLFMLLSLMVERSSQLEVWLACLPSIGLFLYAMFGVVAGSLVTKERREGPASVFWILLIFILLGYYVVMGLV